MKYFILAGEKSGDLHGSNLIREIRLLDPEAKIKAWGGDLMENEGAEILIHHTELAIMGLLGVIQNLSKLKGLFAKFGQQITNFQPNTIIFIDYGGFNLKAARIAKLKGFYTQFYIAPKVWAWNKGRIEDIRKWIDQLYVIFPFEESMFTEKGISTHYVGNPLQDSVQQFRAKHIPFNTNWPSTYVALLPGSRKQEIKAAMPVFKQLVQDYPHIKFIIAGVSEWKEYLLNTGIPVVLDDTYQVLSQAKVAVVTSGTATLETALLHIPQVVVYKTDWLFYSLAKLLVKINYISLVNIILNRKAVPELIQTEFSSEHIAAHLLPLLSDGSEKRMDQLSAYDELQTRIGLSGASKKTAEKIVAYTRSAK
jgi:lipid-A-disaccharide synthase